METKTVIEQIVELCKLTRFSVEMRICRVAFDGMSPEKELGALRKVRGELAKLADYSAEHGEGFSSVTKAKGGDGKVTLKCDGAKVTATGSLWTRLARQAVLLRKLEAEGELTLTINPKSALTADLREWAEKTGTPTTATTTK